MSEKSGYRFSRDDSIYLDPAVQGRGFGAELLGCLLGEARSLGLRLIFAGIESENAASLALHRSHGFTMVGTVTNAGYKFNRWLHVTYMQLDLQAK
jgi:phosphinothricin acetyltransferase